MFLSPQEIAQTRDHALSNLLGISTACLDAGQRFSELLAGAGHESVQQGSKQLAQFGHGQLESMTHFPTSLWLEHSTRSSRLLGAAYSILGDAQKALIARAEAQVRIFDEIVYASLARAAKSSPWEVLPAFDALRITLHSAEETLHEIGNAALQTVQQAEDEMQQLSSNAHAAPAPRKRAAPRRNDAANPT